MCALSSSLAPAPGGLPHLRSSQSNSAMMICVQVAFRNSTGRLVGHESAAQRLHRPSSTQDLGQLRVYSAQHQSSGSVGVPSLLHHAKRLSTCVRASDPAAPPHTFGQETWVRVSKNVEHMARPQQSRPILCLTWRPRTSKDLY